ncbi:hypothetical protein A2456_00350 [Candidatus Nomurabacteria bacterium RIFOXYC2_FULL_36_19]|uniref:Uncharacterized protein n=1 Tax=Candidatus Nomurabacteria bacterium RIFOXYC2_FULL_36_19 TaxID=1801806 RepID=A0A1F6YVY0_9BACT|nr:MAG: hypothetical protein A2456_00350 [Candidatus Nomurabacteria bacterium RIFOXYC2_FULL_36_19]OGJ13898.1 MAG: hypothetical protein A2554_02670 [Candidatus Nomurabacteria bacterium RIFOXYD2_FULL_35_12]
MKPKFEHGPGPLFALIIIIICMVRWWFVCDSWWAFIAGFIGLWAMSGAIAFCCGMSTKEGAKKMTKGPPSLPWSCVLFMVGGLLTLLLTAFHTVEEEQPPIIDQQNNWS